MTDPIAAAAIFPAAEDAPLAVALLRLLAKGRPVSSSQLATTAGRPEAVVREEVARWPNVDFEGTRSAASAG